MIKGSILKKLNTNMPDIIKRIFAKYIRRRVILNKYFMRKIEELNEYYHLNEAEKEELGKKQLKEILIYSYEKVPYYKGLFDKCKFNPYELNSVSQMKCLPILSKEKIIDNFNELKSVEDINCYLASTGGSTGKPLKVLLDTKSIYEEKAFVYNYWSKLGYDYKKSQIITLRGVEFGNKIYKVNPIDNQLILSPFKLNRETLPKYIKIINKFNPEYIHGYPSAIYNLCRLINIENVKLKARIKGIFFVSENIDEIEKKYIEDTLGCKSLIFYGHSERATFAEQYDDGYRFNNLYGIVEFIPEKDKDHYSIVCTGLINRKMPLIRYKLDDVAIIKNGKIDIVGHWDKEMLIGKNDEKISMASINFHSNVFEKIKAYQFEQYNKGEVILKIVEDNKLNENDIKQIKSALDLKLKGIIKFTIKIVDSIELTKRGKHKKILQHIV
ncbi:hypothetical protein [Clostridium sp. YIM B02551]|uniref:hypothetical protein n=1 Tax=Clostridium sp. YIM B02551 TaxID=2910679 RepID=UPI001EEA4397|nr:hypothetical protein [Clostridium sp. YIM B02551]